MMLIMKAMFNKPKLSKNPLSLTSADSTNVGQTEHKF